MSDSMVSPQDLGSDRRQSIVFKAILIVKVTSIIKHSRKIIEQIRIRCKMWSRTTTTPNPSQDFLSCNMDGALCSSDKIADSSSEAAFGTVFNNRSQPRRRQNSSCDQCRAGKRGRDLQIDARGIETHRPCSNCRKWKKHCTSEWIRSCQKPQQNRSKRRCPSTQASEYPENPFRIPQVGVPPASSVQNDLDTGPCLAFDLQQLSPLPYPNCHGLENTTAIENTFWPQPSTETFGDCSNSPVFLYDVETFISDGINQNDLLQDFRETASTQPDFESIITRSSQSSESAQECSFKMAKRRLLRRESSKNAHYQTSPSASKTLGDDHSRLWIKQGLLKIYHDSMEGALSCWLTERNCPYSLSTFNSAEAWSSNWSNRIATRVCSLDEAYSKTGALTKADRTQASNVLNSVIMAFAAQWAQAGPRSQSRLPNDGQSPPQLSDNEFGRDMQVSLWHEARKGLADASENPSFKVIFAGIIFALTQRPMTSEELDHTKQTSDLAVLDELLEFDGPPIFLDIALRKLHDHQRRLFSSAGGSGPALSGANEQTFGLLYWLAVMFDTLSAAMNRRTFVVDDRESNHSSAAAIMASKRYFDGLHTFSGESAEPEVTEPEVAESSIWGDYFLQGQSRTGYSRNHTTRWPCTYEEAACCLADAAPVKVLLFRRVAQLQDLFYQNARPREVERAIRAVLEVYDHWCSTYGVFIADCLANHESLPARIQSWYILLTGHWHLGVFIFADLLEKLDDGKSTFTFNGCKMQATDLSATLRMDSLCVISELGRCSRYGNEDLSFSRSPDFHHAVNKAALLTEPWTVVLVRVFGTAGHILVGNIAMQREFELVMDVEDSLKETKARLQHCIDALWLLGKKSDMAMCAANLLQQAADIA